MPSLPRLRRSRTRSSASRRRGGYFGMPRGLVGGVMSGALDMGENTNLHKPQSTEDMSVAVC